MSWEKMDAQSLGSGDQIYSCDKGFVVLSNEVVQTPLGHYVCLSSPLVSLFVISYPSFAFNYLSEPIKAVTVDDLSRIQSLINCTFTAIGSRRFNTLTSIQLLGFYSSQHLNKEDLTIKMITQKKVARLVPCNVGKDNPRDLDAASQA